MYVCSSIYLHRMSPNTACNCLQHMNLSIVQLLCLYVHVYLFVSISCSHFLSVYSFFIYIYIHLYLFVYIYIYLSLSVSLYTYVFSSFSRVSSARAPPQFFSPLFQFYFTLPQFHLTAAKKAPETCACFPLPCMIPSSAHLFPHSCDL